MGDYPLISRNTTGVAQQGRPLMPSLPVREVNIHHSVTRRTGDPYRDMRTIDQIGRSRFGYFSYSAAVWAEGDRLYIMEGQGNRVGAHTGGRNSSSVGIVAIGNFETEPATDLLIAGLALCIGHFQARGWVSSNPSIFPHRRWKQTACPGNNLFRRVPEINGFNFEEIDMAAVDQIKKHAEWLHLAAHIDREKQTARIAAHTTAVVKSAINKQEVNQAELEAEMERAAEAAAQRVIDYIKKS